MKNIKNKDFSLISTILCVWVLATIIFLSVGIAWIRAESEYGEAIITSFLCSGIIFFIEGFFWNAFAKRAVKNGRKLSDAGYYSIILIMLGVAEALGFLLLMTADSSDDVDGMDGIPVAAFWIGVIILITGIVKYIGRKEKINKKSQNISVVQHQPTGNISSTRKLEELKDMLDKKLITQEEYDNKKQELLNKM